MNNNINNFEGSPELVDFKQNTNNSLDSSSLIKDFMVQINYDFDSDKIQSILQTLCLNQTKLKIRPLECFVCGSYQLSNEKTFKLPCECGQIAHLRCIEKEIKTENFSCPKCSESFELRKNLCFNSEDREEFLKVKNICSLCNIKIDEKNTEFYQCECFQKIHESCIKECVSEILGSNEINLDLMKKFHNFSCKSCKKTLNIEKISTLFSEKQKRMFSELQTLETIENIINEEKSKRKEEARNKQLECEICYEMKNVDKNFITLDCEHRFCRNCLDGYVSSEINTAAFMAKNEIKCPNTDCLKLIEYLIIKEVLSDPNLFEKFENSILVNQGRSNKKEITAKCPNGKCKYFCIVDKSIKDKTLECPLCKEYFCINGCKKPHPNKTCKEVKEKENENNGKENRNNGKEKLFADCPKCKTPIQKIQGCNHITCICGEQFCYICESLDWKNCGHKYQDVPFKELCRVF